MRRPTPNAQEIAARLRRFLGGKRESLVKQAELAGVDSKRLGQWVRRDSPVTPDPPGLIRMARRTNLSLDWLLLGEGTAERGTLQDKPELLAALRAQVVASVATAAKAEKREVEAVSPSGAALLNFATNLAGQEFARWRALRDDFESARTRAALLSARAAKRPSPEALAAVIGRPVRKALELNLPPITPSTVGWVPLSVP